jgi:hypothetical protein
MSKLFITEWTLQAIEFSIKVWKTQHQNPEFGPRQGEIQKILQKSTLAFKGGETQKCTNFLGGKLSFILFWPLLSIFLRASTAVTYIFSAPIYTTTIITLQSYLIKFPYFQRGDSGWKEAQRQGEDRVTLMKTIIYNRHRKKKKKKKKPELREKNLAGKKRSRRNKKILTK